MTGIRHHRRIPPLLREAILASLKRRQGQRHGDCAFAYEAIAREHRVSALTVQRLASANGLRVRG